MFDELVQSNILRRLLRHVGPFPRPLPDLLLRGLRGRLQAPEPVLSERSEKFGKPILLLLNGFRLECNSSVYHNHNKEPQFKNAILSP
jgi:hypothetical protein